MCDPTVRGAIPRSSRDLGVGPPGRDQAGDGELATRQRLPDLLVRVSRPTRPDGRPRPGGKRRAVDPFGDGDGFAGDPDGIGRPVRAEVGGREVREGADVLPDAPSGGPARHGRLETGPGTDARPGGEMQETGRVVDGRTRARDVPLPQPGPPTSSTHASAAPRSPDWMCARVPVTRNGNRYAASSTTDEAARPSMQWTSDPRGSPASRRTSASPQRAGDSRCSSRIASAAVRASRSVAVARSRSPRPRAT